MGASSPLTNIFVSKSSSSAAKWINQRAVLLICPWVFSNNITFYLNWRNIWYKCCITTIPLNHYNVHGHGISIGTNVFKNGWRNGSRRKHKTALSTIKQLSSGWLLWKGTSVRWSNVAILVTIYQGTHFDLDLFFTVFGDKTSFPFAPSGEEIW